MKFFTANFDGRKFSICFLYEILEIGRHQIPNIITFLTIQFPEIVFGVISLIKDHCNIGKLLRYAF
jgi:hypothetical protein